MFGRRVTSQSSIRSAFETVWINAQDEILAQQEAYRRLGGRFITPVPEPRVL